MFKKIKKKDCGFTMIELLVAISIFTIIITISSGIFITSLRSHRTSVALITANSDAQLALEQMSRMIRKGSGKSFFTDTAIGDGSLDNPDFRCLKFQSGNYITYRWSRKARTLEWNNNPNSFAECGNSDAFAGIISGNLRVDLVNFRVDKSASEYYPLVTILLRVGSNKAQISRTTTFTDLEVSVTPRGDFRY